MRHVIVLMMVLIVAGTAVAQDLGNSREQPVKNSPIVTYEPPAVPKQGGDTIGDATVIPGLPYYITGTTDGYVHDYDEMCPYGGNASPDVVYSFTPEMDVMIDLDMCGSGYDTKIYIYDPDMVLMACNDDFYFDDEICGDYVSKIEGAMLFGGITYSIVIDGYGGQSGPYVMDISLYHDCYVTCHPDAVAEGEPALHDGYDDQFNSGCGGTPPSFRTIDWTNDEDGVPPYDGTAWLCGKSGWYLGPEGEEYRDTDWFTVQALETGLMEVTLEPEHPCFLIKLSSTDCATTEPELDVTADCGVTVTLTFPVTAGEEVWLWVGPTDFTGPVTEFNYFMTVSNNMFDVVDSEDMSWGRVKSLYR